MSVQNLERNWKGQFLSKKQVNEKRAMSLRRHFRSNTTKEHGYSRMTKRTIQRIIDDEMNKLSMMTQEDFDELKNL